jgi:His-Xaa-Ser system protein HxsD
MSIESRVEFDLAVFNIESIKRAAYRFSDRFAFNVCISGTTASCVLAFPDTVSPELIDETASNFRKEVLDQDLRQSIRAETESVRNVILAHAFSRTTLVNSDSIQGD